MSAVSSLLPPNVTPLMRRIEAAFAKRLDAIEVPLTRLWNPDTCPSSLLPWLAWAQSVDEWDQAWDEATRRAVIRSSLSVHRKKGTIGAVREALAALGPEIVIEEWWQYGGDPGHFKARILPDAGGVSHKELAQIREFIVRTANLRSLLDEITVEVHRGLDARPVLRMSLATAVETHFRDSDLDLARIFASASNLDATISAAEVRGYARLAIPATVDVVAKWAENLDKTDSIPQAGQFSSSQMRRNFTGAKRLYGAYLLDGVFRFLMVADLLERGDGAGVTAPADVFQSTGVKLNARIYSSDGSLLASDETGTTEWVFSNAIGDWRNRTTLSADDGLWGIHLGHKVDGNTPGPGLTTVSGVWGFGNYNTSDGNSDSAALHEDGVKQSGTPSAFWFRE